MKARYAKGAVALAVLAVAGVGTGIAMGGESSSNAAAPKWNVEYASKALNAELEDVAAVSANEGWAVGYTTPDNGLHRTPVLLHRTSGGRWQNSGLPKGAEQADLNRVEASGPDNVWLFGYIVQDSGNEAVAYRWDGRQWSAVPLPADDHNTDGAVAATVLGPDDVWMMNGARSALHWDGKGWNDDQLPAAFDNGAAALSGTGPDDVWAVGSHNTGDGDSTPYTQPSAAHWNGRSWTTTKTPEYHFGGDATEESADLDSVDSISGNDVWAFGEHTANSDGPGPSNENILLHWDGSSWKKAPAKIAEKVYQNANAPDGAGGLVLGRSWHASKDGSLEEITKNDPVPGRTGTVTDTDKKQKFYPNASVHVPGTNRVWSVGKIELDGQGDANFTRGSVLEVDVT